MNFYFEKREIEHKYASCTDKEVKEILEYLKNIEWIYLIILLLRNIMILV